ncbi:hypothetical protein [Lysinibacillus fusiformis]|uniref:hypothetical protein n=1 Tax=Lysinibacillus fusiformis TaxID=28031 RepID=UPI0023A9FC62|nr:hypothetical protein [Lysinibacillus fusiformis]WEA41813.1 hypothetical protein PWJ66_23590 [Lysinibacillus fusiformis]
MKKKRLIKIIKCMKNGYVFSSTAKLHKECVCTPKILAEAYEGQFLSWSNGKEWGEINHPQLGRVMTYCKTETPCDYTYTAPIIYDDGCMVVHRFNRNEINWDKVIKLGFYNGIKTCAFG